MPLVLRPLSIAVCCAIALAASSVATAAPDGPTFSGEVAAIIFDNCTACHRPGQIGPFSLTNYDEVKRRAKQIALVTERRIMPPWLPHPTWGEFKHARTITDAQIAVLKKWAESGAPEGDATKAPAPPKFKDGWQLGEPDMSLKMPKPFKVPAEGRDIYVHFVFPLKFDKDRYLRGIEVIPGNRRVAHHAVGILDTSGVARRKAAANDGVSYLGNTPGFLPAGFTPGYAPGQKGAFFAEGEAITLKKGTDFVLQMHYHPTGKDESDETQVGLFFTDTPPKRGVSVFLMGNIDIDIPPGEKAYKRLDSYRLDVDYEIRTIWSHMHLIGDKVKVWAELPDGSVRKLLWIDKWDFNWQDTYLYAKPIVLPKGTIVRAEFLWDNSSDNPRNPFSPPQRITEGEQSTNEMGGLILGGLPVRQEEEWVHWLSVIGHYFEVHDKNSAKVQRRRDELERTNKPPATVAAATAPPSAKVAAPPVVDEAAEKVAQERREASELARKQFELLQVQLAQHERDHADVLAYLDAQDKIKLYGAQPNDPRLAKLLREQQARLAALKVTAKDAEKYLARRDELKRQMQDAKAKARLNEP